MENGTGFRLRCHGFLSPNRGNGRSRNGRVRYGSVRYGTIRYGTVRVTNSDALLYFRFKKNIWPFSKDISTTYMYFSMSGQGGQQT